MRVYPREDKSDDGFIIAKYNFIPLEKHLCLSTNCCFLNVCRLHCVQDTWPLVLLHSKLPPRCAVVISPLANLLTVIKGSKELESQGGRFP